MQMCKAVTKAVKEGASIIILSDRGCEPGPKRRSPACWRRRRCIIISFAKGTRTQCGWSSKRGEAREAHHFCLLIGYGAGAVNPYHRAGNAGDLHRRTGHAAGRRLTLRTAEKNFIKAANKSIIKVASKMGISTVQSYRGAQIFEAVGISSKLVIDKYFTGTASRIQGVSLEIIAKGIARCGIIAGFPAIEVDGDVLDNGGQYQWRRDGEYHMWNPDTVAKLQQAVRITGYPTFKQYSKLVNDETKHRCTIRGLLKFAKSDVAIPIEEVEPAKEIVKRFVTGAMSFGSISKESHEALAIAMNQIGGKSNTGEGGEDPERFKPDSYDQNGKPLVWRRSAIKQVAIGALWGDHRISGQC